MKNIFEEFSFISATIFILAVIVNIRQNSMWLIYIKEKAQSIKISWQNIYTRKMQFLPGMDLTTDYTKRRRELSLLFLLQ